MRRSKSTWSDSPETIMSHHFRLAKGIPGVVDATPPYSMYNSPISIHYAPKRRTCSADAHKRKSLNKTQKELNDFVNGRNSSTNGNLRLPLPIRSSLTDVAKPKLLENRNYQPPRRRNATPGKNEGSSDMRNSEKFLRITKFKDAVLSEIISSSIYTDEFILDVIQLHMENLAGIIPWKDLENASEELLQNLDVGQASAKKLGMKQQKKNQPFKLEKIKTPMDLSSISNESSTSSASSSFQSSSSSSSSSSGST